MKKELLTILLEECIKRDFKTMCSDGQMYYTGMCSIAADLADEEIITKEEYYSLLRFLAINKPADANDAHWYDSTREGNQKRFDFLKQHIESWKN